MSVLNQPSYKKLHAACLDRAIKHSEQPRKLPRYGGLNSIRQARINAARIDRISRSITRYIQNIRDKGWSEFEWNGSISVSDFRCLDIMSLEVEDVQDGIMLGLIKVSDYKHSNQRGVETISFNLNLIRDQLVNTLSRHISADIALNMIRYLY